MRTETDERSGQRTTLSELTKYDSASCHKAIHFLDMQLHLNIEEVKRFKKKAQL